MGNLNRGSRSGGGRGFERRGFNDRSSRGPVEMHQAVCSKCGKDCELPFRPTNDRPVFCSSCFENNRTSDSGSSNFDEREMFTATCADCGSSCQVPFRPTSGKPVFCSNCFGDKKEGGKSNKEQFEQLNSKLDKILTMLTPKTVAQAIVEEVEEQPVETEKKVKIAKKKF